MGRGNGGSTGEGRQRGTWRGEKKPFVPRGPRPLADLAGPIMDPMVRRKSGMSVELIGAWDSLVGESLATSTRPLEIRWPRRHGEDDPFEPATLVVGCDGGSGLQLQHESDQVIARINAFFGFAAIARLKPIQRPAAPEARTRKPATRPLSSADRDRIEQMVGRIEDERLKAALDGFAKATLARRDR